VVPIAPVTCWNCSTTAESSGFEPEAPPIAKNSRSSSIRPRPPNTPRVLSSKSWFSSRTALQFRMRWSVGSLFENIPSSGIVWRGPASNIQVTLSVRPFGWQTMQPPHDSCDIRVFGPRPVKNSSAPSWRVAAAEPGAGGAVLSAVPTIAGIAPSVMSIAVSERLMKLCTQARVPAALITMPRGALPAMSVPDTACRSTRTIWPGPATSGAPTVGTPAPSAVRRTTRSLFWITTHASLPFGRQVIATGFDRNRRGTAAVSRLIPRFRFSGASWRTVAPVCAAVISVRVSSNTDTRPCTIWLKRSGPFGEAPVLTT
jgi:hypothetical protein